MVNRYRMVDNKLVQLSDAEQAEYDAEQKAWADDAPNRHIVELRRQRDALLVETDYMALGDVTLSDTWKTYRQALRDITKTYKSIKDDGFAFPTKPKS